MKGRNRFSISNALWDYKNPSVKTRHFHPIALGIGAASFASGDGGWRRRQILEAEADIGDGGGYWRRRRILETEAEVEINCLMVNG